MLAFHRAANLFPLMSDAELQLLKEDIEANGQRVPIDIYEGEVLDGRNRARACEQLGIEVKVRVVHEVQVGDAVQYVLSSNLHRRHLNAAQRAIVAGRLRAHFDAAARRRQGLGASIRRGDLAADEEHGDARDRAGAAVGVSGKSVDFACRVLGKGDADVIAACDRGALPISLAARLVELSADRQRELLNAGARAIRTALRSEPSVEGTPAIVARLLSDAYKLHTFAEQKGGLIEIFRSADYDVQRLLEHLAHLKQLSTIYVRLGDEADRAMREISRE